MASAVATYTFVLDGECCSLHWGLQKSNIHSLWKSATLIMVTNLPNFYLSHVRLILQDDISPLKYILLDCTHHHYL